MCKKICHAFHLRQHHSGGELWELADPKFSEAKRASDDDKSDADASDEDEKVKPPHKECKSEATAPARKSHAPAKKTPNMTMM